MPKPQIHTGNVPAVDSVYLNGKIYTVNGGQPWVEAMAIRDGRFIEIGSNKDVSCFKISGTGVLKTVFEGAVVFDADKEQPFTDKHWLDHSRLDSGCFC